MPEQFYAGQFFFSFIQKERSKIGFFLTVVYELMDSKSSNNSGFTGLINIFFKLLCIVK